MTTANTVSPTLRKPTPHEQINGSAARIAGGKNYRHRSQLCAGSEVRSTSSPRKRRRSCTLGGDPFRKFRDRTGQSL